MKNILLFIIFLGMVYLSPAQKKPSEYLFGEQQEQPEMLKHEHREFKEQQLEQERLKEQQFLNTKQEKNGTKIAMNASDRAVLETFYNASDGNNWKYNTNWLSGDGSNWYGITLDANGRVTAIRLNNNQLSGSIPAQLGNLTNLQALDLTGNQLEDSIPAELGNLTNLVWLYLRDNHLSGSIPVELWNLTNLLWLDLSYNQISGSIPAEIEHLTNLHSLYLSDNQLSGDMPTQLGSLTNLQYLSLDGNQFTSLPDLSALVNLYYWSKTVDNNFLNFGDLESSGISWSSYGPQANVAMSKTENSGNITFTVSVGGTNNAYKWYKNDVEISGETTNSLTVANNDDGIYYCEITNPGFPDLYITSVAEGIGSVSLNNGVITNEYDALVALYDTTNGNNWINNRNWKTSEPVDYWHGVNVRGTHITEIDLHGNQLSGNIPAELGDLTNLKVLDMNSNQLSGSIPAHLGNLTNLQWLDLNSNQLSGSIPDSLGNLINLKALYLHLNQLSGSIPDSLKNLTNLEYLYLFRNQLTGSIPAQLGNLTNLQRCSLSYNQLSGSIPAELGSLTNLQNLYLNSNQLSGSIPAQLGNLTNLQTLALDYNQLSGNIPAQLGGLTNLMYLYLTSNQLSGSIPTNLGNLTKLRWFFLDDNKLNGSVPTSLGNLTNLDRFFLDNNQLTSLPNLSALVNLNWCRVNDNYLDFGDLQNSGISWDSYAPQANVAMAKTENGGNITFTVSVDGTYNAYKWYKNDVEISGENTNSLTVANTDDGIYYCKITNSSYPDLILTSIAQGIGVSLTNGVITNEYDALIALYDATNGDNWNKNTNWKTTEPVDYWYGVNVSGTHVSTISLYNNQLSGSIPAELGNLTNLQSLSLSSNQLNGSIPAQLGSLTNLQSLYLNNNQFSGSIPTALGSLTNLQNLYLNSNKFSGSIPTELGNLTNLQKLYLNDNQLIGSIPAQLDSLTNLQELYLNDNQFTSLPDLSALVNLYSWGTAVQNNSLDFGDFENADISWYSYSPQTKVGTEQNIVLSEGENKTISISLDGNNNSYQWYKDGTAINGATSSEYTISNFNEATDAGVYVCKINDSNYPHLTLESNDITISKEPTVIDDNDNSQFSIYPNPVSDRLTIHFSKEKAEILKVLDLTGKRLFSRKVNSETESIDLSNLESGIYILQLEFENQIISKKIIKN